MSIKSLAGKIHAKWLHETQSLPYWFRWLETEAPIVAAIYRAMLRFMWVYWLPAMILFAFTLKLSKLFEIPANMSMLAFAFVCAGFGLVVFLFPAIAIGKIGISALRWNRTQGMACSRKMSFFTVFFLFTSAMCFLAVACFIGIAVFALLQK